MMVSSLVSFSASLLPVIVKGGPFFGPLIQTSDHLFHRGVLYKRLGLMLLPHCIRTFQSLRRQPVKHIASMSVKYVRDGMQCADMALAPLTLTAVLLEGSHACKMRAR